jgi:hypothetical protein
LMGAVWLSSSAARIMIFIVYLRGIVADVKRNKNMIEEALRSASPQ